MIERRGRQGRGRVDGHPRRGGGRCALRRRARAPRQARRARQQRGRPVPEPGRGDHAEGISHRDRAERLGHLAHDPRRGDQGLHPPGRRQGPERHPLAAQRHARDGPLGRRARRGREHDEDALDRVVAPRHQARARSPRASSTRRRCARSTRPVVAENVANTVPLGRMGTEEEWAWLVAYLASPAGDFFSGTRSRSTAPATTGSAPGRPATYGEQARARAPCRPRSASRSALARGCRARDATSSPRRR